MKHLLTFLCLCAGLTAQGREISNTNGLPQPRPVYRYLFLVDTSSAMARQKNVTLDTLSKLIAGGVGGHIHTGEFWNIWTFDDQLHTNVFQAQMWNLAPRNDAANRAARLLRNQTFKHKKGRLAGPMAAIADEATLSGALTVVLFTDGSEPLNGTPFDQDINDIFTRHAAGMRKAKKPFVIALVAQDGKFVAHAVTPGGEPPHIPQPPKRPAPDPSPENEGAALRTPTQAGTNPNATLAETAPAGPAPPPKALTIEEIEETFRQSRISQPKTVAPAPAQRIIAAPNSIESNQSSNTTARPALFDTTSPLSSSQFRKLCKRGFLNYLRVREWQDLVSQLRQSVRSLGMKLGSLPAEVAPDSPVDADRIHQSLLAGLLSHIGMKTADRQDFLGARGASAF